MMTEIILTVALSGIPWNDVADWQRFPPEAVCEAHYKLACAYLTELEGRAEVLGGWGREQLQRAIDDTRDAKAFWWAAWWVTFEKASIEQKQEWAGVARNLIGEPAYWSGHWPNPIPLWTVPYH